jgi:5S rRNA maturation endonuclease (ribonuclease M5)
LSTHLKDKLEKIQLTLAKLTEESAKGKPIIVEGKKDAQALQELGVKCTIYMVKTGGKSFLEAAQQIVDLGSSEVILLLDFDRRGRDGMQRLQMDLERSKIRVNVGLWRELKGLVGHEIQAIESLNTYLCTLQEKTNPEFRSGKHWVF